MINVEAKRCKTLFCDIMATQKKYKGYCMRCFIHTFPTEKVARNYKTKEQSVVDFIKENFPKIKWICDKIINGGCSKRRPDIMLDLGTHIIIIEIDENSHDRYDFSKNSQY
jgi:hypothetical protein